MPIFRTVEVLKAEVVGFEMYNQAMLVTGAGVLHTLIEPRCEKTGLRGLQGFRPGLTQTRLHNHTRWLEA